MAYAAPNPAELKAYYPAFADVLDATVQLYITRVTGSDVDESWIERDYSPAIMAAAAHRMARNGVLKSVDDGETGDLDGLTGFRSGGFSAQFSEAYVKQQVDGGWASSSYGQDYLALLRVSKGGPRVSTAGALPCNTGFNGWAGGLPPWQL